MKIPHILIVCLAIIGLAACGKKQQPPTPAPAAVPAPQTQAAPAPTGFTTVSYTDGKKWQNGIDITDPVNFFIRVANDQPIPIRVGHLLRFNAAGDVVVQRVYLYKQEKESQLFIQVDKPLDPIGDGSPHRFTIVGQSFAAHNFSDGKDWKNGILLKNPAMFLMALYAGDSMPFKIGDRLRFPAAGEVLVNNITIQSKGSYSGVFIVVSKPLDPEKDGYPNFFHIVQ